MPFLATHTYDDGSKVGFDADTRQWVPIDPQAEQGSFLGNVARAAGTSVQEIGQGVQEAVLPGDEQTQLQGQLLRQQQQAQSATAPWASAIGGAAPEVVAGLASIPLTGGMGLAGELLTQGAIGTVMGGIRPGSFDERLGRAAIGGALSIGGAALEPAAKAGIGAGLRLFDRMHGATLSRLAPEAEVAGQTIRQAGRVTGGDFEEAAPMRGVGAAQTPQEMIEPALREESAALGRTEDVGASTLDDRMVQQMRERGQRLGMRESVSFGSRGGSPIRRLRSGLELTPFGDPIDQAVKAHNQGKVANYLARALELPDAESRTSIFADNLDDARATIGNKFNYVEERLPDVSHDDFVKALSDISQRKGPGGKSTGQKIVQGVIDDVPPQGKKWAGDEIMQTRSNLSAKMADLYKAGDTSSGETVMQAVNRIDDMLAKRLRKEGKDKLAAFWEKARTQWQILQMVDRPGAVNLATGEVNARTVFGQMRKRKSSGGFGERPAVGTAARDLYDALEFQMHNETGEAMTGARALMKSNFAKSAIGGGLGVLGVNALGGLFD